MLAALLILALGCRKKNTELPPEQSDVSDIFDIAEAMNMFYGNYDAKAQTSVVSLPKEKSSLPAPGEEQMTVRPLFSTFNSGAQSFVLATYAVPSGDSYDCHACAPIIGMAVFSQKGLKWTMDASNRAITIAGGWGKPPADIKLVQIGPSQYAVELMDSGGGQGETTKVLDLLIPWNSTVNLGLERIIADDDNGLCDPNGGLPCYANQRSVTFIRNEKAEFYDLQLELTGTDLTESKGTSTRARKVHGLEILKVENGRYTQVSRQGDLTAVDHVVAERENLR